MKTHFCCLLTALMLAFSITTQAQIITTVAGDSLGGYNGDNIPALNAGLNNPYSVALDATGNLYIADAANNRVRMVNTAGTITTIAGTGVAGYSGDDSAATNAKLFGPVGVALDGSGNIYISDDYNNRIRKINTAGIITTVAGNGTMGYSGDNGLATNAQLHSQHGIAVDAAGNIYVCDALNNVIRKVSAAGTITTIAGTSAPGYTGDNGPATAAELSEPYGVALDGGGNIYFTQRGNNCVRKINPAGIITTLAGGNATLGFSGDGGPASAAKLYFPVGIAVDLAGNVYVADYFNARVRKINPAGIISTYAGTDTFGYSGDGGPATLARLYGPVGLAVNNSGDLYISEFVNDRVRLVKNVEAVCQINNQELVKIFPNPCHGDFEVQVNSVTEYPAQISVTDVTGKTITCLTAAPNRTTSISLNAPPGLYFVTVTINQTSQTSELMLSL